MNAKQIQNLILLALKDNHQQAYNTLLKYYWNDIYNYIFIKVQNEETAKDLAIQTFTKIFKKLHLYSFEFDFKTWIISITHNMIIDFLRKKYKDIIFTQEQIINKYKGIQISAEEELIQKQQKETIRNLVEQLPNKYREIIKLRFLEELSYNEISNQLELSLDNIKVRLFRAKKILSDLILKHR